MKNGDIVKILTDRNRKKPNSDWLNFVKTNTAKEKIKVSLTKFKKEKADSFGKNMFSKFNKYIKKKK